MDITNSILSYRRFLKRRNYSTNTVKNYLSGLKQFLVWVDVPIEQAEYLKVLDYIDFLLDSRQTEWPAARCAAAEQHVATAIAPP